MRRHPDGTICSYRVQRGISYCGLSAAGPSYGRKRDMNEQKVSQTDAEPPPSGRPCLPQREWEPLRNASGITRERCVPSIRRPPFSPAERCRLYNGGSCTDSTVRRRFYDRERAADGRKDPAPRPSGITAAPRSIVRKRSSQSGLSKRGVSVSKNGAAHWKWLYDTDFDADRFPTIGAAFEAQTGSVKLGFAGRTVRRLFSIQQAIDFALRHPNLI